MHKPTQQPETCTLESPSAQATSISREKHTLDHSRVRFSHSNWKVPAAYFPLLRNEPTKTPRKTASRVHRVESTCISKKIKQWKVQTAQKTRRNSPLGHERLESGASSSQPHCEIIWRASSPSCRPTKEIIPQMAARTHG